MSSTITAASYVGSVPATAIQMPDDGDPRSAAWIRALAAMTLANDAALFGRVFASYSDEADDGDASPPPFFTYTAASYTVGPEVVVPDAKTGDALIVRASLLCRGDFQNVVTTRARAETGHGGGSPSGYANVTGAVARASEPATSTTWIILTMQGRLVVDRDGDVSVVVVGRTFLDSLDVQSYSLVVELYRS